ncbi:MAG: FxDxF family PEP-CTERM protein [Rubrivivax sp.]|nr:FxDxF family PEP-CTERM protein [Rubrivivax sp.]
MKNHCLLACTISLAATFAQAQQAQDMDPPPIGVVLNPVGSNVFAGSFTRNVNGLFSDTFTFTPTSYTGTVSVRLIPASGRINFGAALLNGQGFSFDPDAGQTAFSFSAMVNAGQPLELTVLGFAGDAETLTAGMGSYTGSVLAVPEPSTYGLMAAGLVLLAARARAQKRRQESAPA